MPLLSLWRVLHTALRKGVSVPLGTPIRAAQGRWAHPDHTAFPFPFLRLRGAGRRESRALIITSLQRSHRQHLPGLCLSRVLPAPLLSGFYQLLQGHKERTPRTRFCSSELQERDGLKWGWWVWASRIARF